MEASLIIICSTHKKRCMKFCKSVSEVESTRFLCPECLKKISDRESPDFIDISNFVSTSELIESMFLINEDFTKLQQFFIDSFEKIEFFETLLGSLKKAMNEVSKKFLDVQRRIFEEVFLKKWNVNNEGLYSCFLDFAAVSIEQSKWSHNINVAEQVKTQFKGLFKESAKELKRFFRQRTAQDSENDHLKEKQQRIEQAQKELNKELNVYLNWQMKQLNPKWVEEPLEEKGIGIKASPNQNEQISISKPEVKQEQPLSKQQLDQGNFQKKTETSCEKDQKEQAQTAEIDKQVNQRGRSLNLNSEKGEKDLCIQGQIASNDGQVDHPKQDQKEIKPQQQQRENTSNVYPKKRELSQGKNQSGIVIYQVNKNSDHGYEIKKIETQPRAIQQLVETENKEKNMTEKQEKTAEQKRQQEQIEKVDQKVEEEIQSNQSDRQKERTDEKYKNTNPAHQKTEQLEESASVQLTNLNDKQAYVPGQLEEKEKDNSDSNYINGKPRNQNQKRKHPQNEYYQPKNYEKALETNKYLQSSQNSNFQHQISSSNSSSSNTNNKNNNYSHNNKNQRNSSVSKMVHNGYYINTEDGNYREMDNKNQSQHQLESNRQSNVHDNHNRSSKQNVRAHSKNNQEEMMKNKQQIIYQPKEENGKSQIFSEQNRNNFRNNNNAYHQEYTVNTDVKNNRGQSKNYRRQSKDNRGQYQESNQRTRLNNNQIVSQVSYIRKDQQESYQRASGFPDSQ